MIERCGILPPDFEHTLAGGTACDRPRHTDTEHLTTTPDGRRWRWDGFECAYPEDCSYDGDGECCVSYGEIPAP